MKDNAGHPPVWMTEEHQMIADMSAQFSTAVQHQGMGTPSRPLTQTGRNGPQHLHGGYGFMQDYDIGGMWADARVRRIHGGTNEIMKELIARAF